MADRFVFSVTLTKNGVMVCNCVPVHLLPEDWTKAQQKTDILAAMDREWGIFRAAVSQALE